MHDELVLHLKSVTRLIYFVTEEEDRFLVQLQEAMRSRVDHVKVYNAALGLLPLANLTQDWVTKAHAENKKTINIHDALIEIYKEPTPESQEFYILTDPERWLKDPHIQRRILNIIHQGHQDVNTVKVLICVGNQCLIPRKLARYTEVVYDSGLSSSEIQEIVSNTCEALKIEVPSETSTLFSGLTGFEIQAALIQTYKKTRGNADEKMLSEYRFRQLKKTNLIDYVDASAYDFDQVGGVGRFKAWAAETAVAWSPEGREFGLEPPKGVLAVGIWGSGKSLSIKCLANAWGLPLLQLDLGKLRQSGVGDSESNTYQAIQIIESVAPCVVWCDEAEKSLSGGHSSSYTDAGTTSRMIGALSTWHQETKVPVCLALTANSLKTLPVEFTNRMDERWFFDLPSTVDRIDIIKIHLLKRRQNHSDFDLYRLAEAAKDMVGREIEQAIKAAMVRSFVAGKEALDEALLVSELNRKPRIVRTMTDEIRETLDWVGFDALVDDGVRARFAADPGGPDRDLAIG
jgi:SpoVK/Ycf46/Vps4 family AAA+-type ATPase